MANGLPGYDSWLDNHGNPGISDEGPLAFEELAKRVTKAALDAISGGMSREEVAGVLNEAVDALFSHDTTEEYIGRHRA